MGKFSEVAKAARKQAAEDSTTTATAKPKAGKRSSDAHTQVSAYVRTRIRAQVKIALIEDGNRIDFSDLVDHLLEQWLESRKR